MSWCSTSSVGPLPPRVRCICVPAISTVLSVQVTLAIRFPLNASYARGKDTHR